MTAWITRHDQPVYRARQIFDALYHRDAQSGGDLKQLPEPLRRELVSAFPPRVLQPVEERRSADGTVKYLSRLEDGETLETVLIPAPSRNTLCVSTQVGCAYACAFCASGLNGFQRNLTSGEIVQQLLLIQRFLKKTAARSRVTNVVFMGMGESLANYVHLLKAIRILNSPEGLGIAARKITISTVGLVPMIERLSKEGLQLELAISLHAPHDDLRGQIMPVNRKYPVQELLQACRAYARTTRRLITFEYILIDRVNDEPAHARDLAALLKGLMCKVNLIPCHPIPGRPFQRPSNNRMFAFGRILKEGGISCTLRKSRGLDIEGACGQLRLRQEEEAAPGASALRLRQEEAVVKSSHAGSSRNHPRP